VHRKPALQALQQVAGCVGYTDSQCQLQPSGLLTRKVYLSGSDILGRQLTGAEISAISGYLGTWARTNSTTELQVEPFGGAVASKADADTAFPWRSAVASVQWKVDFSAPPTSAVKTSTYNWISAGHANFGPASVGAYINYLEPSRPISAYYGPNYSRLRQLRTKYDPSGLFRGSYASPAA
jgi:hypothetical protein